MGSRGTMGATEMAAMMIDGEMETRTAATVTGEIGTVSRGAGVAVAVLVEISTAGGMGTAMVAMTGGEMIEEGTTTIATEIIGGTVIVSVITDDVEIPLTAEPRSFNC